MVPHVIAYWYMYGAIHYSCPKFIPGHTPRVFRLGVGSLLPFVNANGTQIWESRAGVLM